MTKTHMFCRDIPPESINYKHNGRHYFLGERQHEILKGQGIKVYDSASIFGGEIDA